MGPRIDVSAVRVPRLVTPKTFEDLTANGEALTLVGDPLVEAVAARDMEG